MSWRVLGVSQGCCPREVSRRGGVPEGVTLKMLRRGMVPWEKRCTKSVSSSRLM